MACDKSESTEPVCETQGIHNLKELEELVAKADLKDALRFPSTSVTISTSDSLSKESVISSAASHLACRQLFNKTLKPALALLWEKGVRLINDSLVLAESREPAVIHVKAVLYLLWFPKEISAGASTDNGIPGPDSGHCGHGLNFH